MKRRTLISSVGLALTAPPIFALDALEKQKRLDDLQSMVARSAAKLDKIKRKPPDIVSFPGGVTATRQPEGDWLVGTKVAAFGAFANRASFPLQLVVGVDESFGQIIADYALTVEKANSNFINYRCNLDFGLQNVYLRFLQPEISNWATIRKTPPFKPFNSCKRSAKSDNKLISQKISQTNKYLHQFHHGSNTSCCLSSRKFHDWSFYG